MSQDTKSKMFAAFVQQIRELRESGKTIKVESVKVPKINHRDMMRDSDNLDDIGESAGMVVNEQTDSATRTVARDSQLTALGLPPFKGSAQARVFAPTKNGYIVFSARFASDGESVLAGNVYVYSRLSATQLETFVKAGKTVHENPVKSDDTRKYARVTLHGGLWGIDSKNVAQFVTIDNDPTLPSPVVTASACEPCAVHTIAQEMKKWQIAS